MWKRKRFREKIGNQTVVVGLAGLAVLLALTDNALRILLSFPDRHTSLGRAWSEAINSRSATIREYLEWLKEASGHNVRVVLSRLEKKGLVKRTAKGFQLTSKGIVISKRIKEKVSHFVEWDGKWRLITFDIPEKLRKERDWLRSVLKEYDYKPLHKSVFIGKFPIPEEIYRSFYNRKLSSYIRLLTVGEIDEEEMGEISKKQ